MKIKRKHLKELVGSLQGEEYGCSLSTGKNYLVRTVTMFYVGRLKAISNSDIVLDQASWVADTGRFGEALSTGSLNEVEPFVDDVIINRACLVDCTVWRHELPREAK